MFHGRRLMGFSGRATVASSQNDAEHLGAADIDGDGDIDILCALSTGSKIRWYRNNNNGASWTQMPDIASPHTARGVHAADIDGDGDMDVFSASEGDQTFAWYENDGAGNFGSQQVIDSGIPNGKSAQFVDTGDIDGDGDLDVVTAGRSCGVAWYENTDGSGTFGSRQEIAVPYNSDFPFQYKRAQAADIDGDGDLDVVAASFGQDHVAWFENTDGSGTFGTMQVIGTSHSNTQHMYAADLDGDGDIDVLVASYSDNKMDTPINQSAFKGKDLKARTEHRLLDVTKYIGSTRKAQRPDSSESHSYKLWSDAHCNSRRTFCSN
eukprot:gene16958-20148_t